MFMDVSIFYLYIFYLTVLSTGCTVHIQIFIRFDSDRMLVTELKRRK